MRKLLMIIAAACIYAAIPAHAEPGVPPGYHQCTGDRIGMRDHDMVGDCLIKYPTKAWDQLGNDAMTNCDGNWSNCDFYGHVVRRQKTIKGEEVNFPYWYVIDRLAPLCAR